MPTVIVNRDRLFAGVGRTYTDEQFDELCFEFGVELDEVTSERRLVAKEQGESAAAGLSDDVLYRIEVPANRYDLLSLEGIVRAVRAFTGATVPDGLGEDNSAHVLRTPLPASGLVLRVHAAAAALRPYAAMAVLRGVRMTPAVYASLMDVQDKLHGGLGRRRAIVSMGTYDLGLLAPGAEGLEFAAVARDALRFVPLNRGPGVVDGDALLALLEGDLALRKYVPLVRDMPALPVLRVAHSADARDVLSVVPLLNSDGCKISLATRDILVDVTGTDETKVGVALDMLVTTFARYAAAVESVRTVYAGAHGGEACARVYPLLATRTQDVDVAYVNRAAGLALPADAMVALLARMMLPATPSADGAALAVAVPPTRPDVMHACDVMEDVAVAYGFNRVPVRLPPTAAVAVPQALNKLGDALRREAALAGWTEVLTFALCAAADNYALLRRTDPGAEAVRLANAKSADFEAVQTTLLPAMLRTLAANKRQPLPLRIFQVADVVLQDALASDVGARNERRLCAAYCGTTSGFEVVHGLLDRVMAMLAVPAWRIAPADDRALFPGRQARVLLGEGDAAVEIGLFGVVHPDVAAAFEAPYVCSVLELNIEPFL